jgi:hypothetical protein
MITRKQYEDAARSQTGWQRDISLELLAWRKRLCLEDWDFSIRFGQTNDPDSQSDIKCERDDKKVEVILNPLKYFSQGDIDRQALCPILVVLLRDEFHPEAPHDDPRDDIMQELSDLLIRGVDGQ